VGRGEGAVLQLFSPALLKLGGRFLVYGALAALANGGDSGRWALILPLAPARRRGGAKMAPFSWLPLVVAHAADALRPAFYASLSRTYLAAGNDAVASRSV